MLLWLPRPDDIIRFDRSSRVVILYFRRSHRNSIGGRQGFFDDGIHDALVALPAVPLLDAEHYVRSIRTGKDAEIAASRRGAYAALPGLEHLTKLLASISLALKAFINVTLMIRTPS